MQDIVSNFQRVHTDLQDLKEEYIQQKLNELDSAASNQVTEAAETSTDPTLAQHSDAV